MTITQEYKVRINEILLYIENHLSLDLSVEELAEQAFFSKFHFNRVFKAVTGESVYQHIKRIRLERASYFLKTSSCSISLIAQKCGFTSISSFSDSFKRHFGLSARDYRKKAIDERSMKDKIELEVEIKYLPPIKTAYVKNIGSFRDDDENSRILSHWIDGLKDKKKKLRFMRLGFDSLQITKESHFRFDLCYIIDGQFSPPPEISIKELPPQKAVTLRILDHSTAEAIGKSCAGLNRWIVDNGYERKMDAPVRILYQRDILHSDDDDRDKLFVMEICFPIER